MLYFRMRDCKVVRFMPRRAAAPFGPPDLAFRFFERFYDPVRSDACDASEFRTSGEPGSVSHELRHGNIAACSRESG